MGTSYSVSRERRFKKPKGATDKAPHAFDKRTTLSTTGCGGSKDERWHYDRDVRLKVEQSPGPGNYEFRHSFQPAPYKQNGMGRIKRFQEKSVDYCLEKDFISKETPGPGQY